MNMKFKLAAVAALIICSLYGCGNDRDTASSLYTPAPITPRPTFDTTKYRTKEEMTAKQDKNFVIKEDDGIAVGPYQDKSNEYISTEITPSPNPIKTLQSYPSATTVPSAVVSSPSYVTKPNGVNWNSQILSGENDNSVIYTASASDNTAEPTPAPVLTPRPAYSVPGGFVSKDYPYKVYSNDGRTYLGKITINTDDPESIWNPNGPYGSSTSTTSIYNTYGIYGSKNSMFSAFNDYATAPPKIFDNSGQIVGYLSSNLIHSNGITPDDLKLYAEKNGI